MFRSLFTSSIVIMMIAISPPQASAAEAPQPTQRELELERQVQALKAQLEDANKTIADLQDQVNDGASAPASSAAIADSSAAPTPAGSDQSVATAPPISVAEPTSTTPTFASGLNLGEDPSDMSERQAEVARTPAAITSLGPA